MVSRCGAKRVHGVPEASRQFVQTRSANKARPRGAGTYPRRERLIFVGRPRRTPGGRGRRDQRPPRSGNESR